MADDGEDEASADDPPDDESIDPTDATLSVDATLTLLSDGERRDILDILAFEADGSVNIDELVNRLVRRQTDRTGEFPSPDSIEMRLHHVHLPKLVEVGVVEYDAQGGEIYYWSDDRLEEWLERAQSEDSE